VGEKLEYKQRTPVFFLGYKNETIVITRSPGEFQLTTIDASTGKHRWEERHVWEQSHHGGHRRHPVIMDDVVYQQPHAYDLRTGKKKWSTDCFGGNCGTLSACNSMMFSRLSSFPRLIDLRDGASTENLVEVTRPVCWINIIPAGGMILVPEAGSGCSCTYPMHASMAFLSP
jgi:outer membrane protein assembly factor BamB